MSNMIRRCCGYFLLVSSTNREGNIFNFVLSGFPFGNGSTAIFKSMKLVVLDGGNLPVRFTHVFSENNGSKAGPVFSVSTEGRTSSLECGR